MCQQELKNIKYSVGTLRQLIEDPDDMYLEMARFLIR